MNRIRPVPVPKPTNTGDEHTHHWIPHYLGNQQYELHCITCKMTYGYYLLKTGITEL